ncbi:MULTISPECIES: DMT family transporter [unclassified Variovorax]|uniref:DMT family transporter n=1 Tax=unclassified Variovorax TaxID=663243 RepID=UPI00257740AB|nr:MULTISPECIES: DMT family transporter [unclassified Variovorax]MDM0088737.1 DMT family transporter [Variovorax sp. J22G40]MDM0146810.1 DMT family transporter [Variovorax sp. J2P1-31]
MMRNALLALWARPLWLLWLPPAFWAGNLVLGRALGPVFPPVSLAVGRWVVALAVLAPFVWRQAWRERALLARHWRLIAACGAFGIAGYNALGYLALQTVPAASVAFLNSTLPLMVPLAALLLGVERITWKTVAGIAISFVGVTWIVARGDMASLAALRFDGGELLVILAVANYAVYSVLLRRKPAAISPLVFLLATMAMGLLVLMPFWALELARGARIPRDPASLGAVLYIGIFASLFAFILWNRCVATLGATVTGVSFHLVALFTALLAFVALGEPVRAFHVAGIVLILLGFFVTTLRPAARVAAPSSP